MDSSKNDALIQWMNKLNRNIRIGSLSDLSEGEQFITLLNMINGTSDKVATKEERFDMVQKFIKEKYDKKLVNQVSFDKLNDLELAKISILLLAVGVLGQHQELFSKAALSLNEQSQLELMVMLKQVKKHSNLNLHELITQKSSEQSRASMQAKYELRQKDALIKALNNRLEKERHRCFVIENDFKQKSKLVASKEETIRALVNQVRELKRLPNQEETFETHKMVYDRTVITIAESVKKMGDVVRLTKTENDVITNEKNSLMDEVHILKETNSRKDQTIKNLEETVEGFRLRDLNRQQVEGKDKLKLQQQESKINEIQEELSAIKDQLKSTLKELEEKKIHYEEANKLALSQKEEAKTYCARLKSEREEFSKKEQMLVAKYEDTLLEKLEVHSLLEAEKKACEELKKRKIPDPSEEIQSLKEQLNQLQHTYENLQTEKKAIDSKCIKIQEQFIKKELEGVNLGKKIKDMAAEKLVVNTKLTQELDQLRQDMVQKIIHLKENVSRLENENENLKTKAQKDYKNVKIEQSNINAAWKDRLVKMKVECNETKKSLNQTLQDKEETERALKQQIAELQHANKQEIAKNKQLKEQKKVLAAHEHVDLEKKLNDVLVKQKEEEITAAREEIAEIQRALNEETARTNTLKEQNTLLQDQKKQIEEKAKAEYDELKRNLTQQLHEKSEECLERDSACKEEIAKNKSLEGQIKDLKLEQTNKTGAFIESFQSDISQLKKEYEKEFKKLGTNFAADLQQLKDLHADELATSQSKNDDVTRALQDAQKKCDEIISEKNKLMAEVKENHLSEKKILLNQITSINEVIDDVRNECQQLRKENTTQSKPDEVHVEIEILENEVEYLKKELEETREEKQDALGNLKEYEVFNLVFTAMCCSFFIVLLYA